MDNLPTTGPWKRVIDAIDQWDAVRGRLEWSDERFVRLARELFDHQYRRNPAYRAYCDRQGVEPGDIERATDVPSVSTEVFKHVDLMADDDPTIERAFLTSGTTDDARGRHAFVSLAAYDASLRAAFRRFCHPEGDELRVVAAVQPPDDAPQSSLSYMVDRIIQTWGDSASEYVVHRRDDEEISVEADRFGHLLNRAVTDDIATLVIGTAFGLTSCFKGTTATWDLPERSMVIETGGFKGRHASVSRADLYRWFDERLGLPAWAQMSEYSMTELSSQAYTPWWIDHRGTGPETRVSGPEDPRVFMLPPWARVMLLDPRSLEPFVSTARPPASEPTDVGLIRWHDLANVGSVQAIQTSDRGRVHPDGSLELLGRAEGADLRGCSLTVEDAI